MTQDEMITAPIPSVSDPAALIGRAAEALAKRGALCVPDHRGTISKWYRGCLLDGPDAGWVAVVGHQNPESARLIEAAVAYRYKEGSPAGVVAILEKHPSASSKAALPKDDYVTRYQTVAWQGLNVLFTFRDDAASQCHAWKQTSLSPADDFPAIARDVELVLNLDKETWIPIEGSNEAEGLVRPSVHTVLKRYGFKRERGIPAPKGTSLVKNEDDGEGTGGKGYQGFWRRGASDGLWSRTTGTPHRIALEVKVSEDVDAPLCQVIDHLGAAGAVLVVRVGGKPDYRGAKAPMDQLQGRLPVRYIHIDWDNCD
jgi:hypothetical protein